MPKVVVMDRLTLCGDGSIELEWLLQTAEADGSVITDARGMPLQETHRHIVDPDGDLAASIDEVCSHLDRVGFTTTQAQRDRMKGLAAGIDAIARNDTDIDRARAAAVARKVAALDAMKPVTSGKKT